MALTNTTGIHLASETWFFYMKVRLYIGYRALALIHGSVWKGAKVTSHNPLNTKNKLVVAL
jgi:hypothetical protein